MSDILGSSQQPLQGLPVAVMMEKVSAASPPVVHDLLLHPLHTDDYFSYTSPADPPPPAGIMIRHYEVSVTLLQRVCVFLCIKRSSAHQSSTFGPAPLLSAPSVRVITLCVSITFDFSLVFTNNASPSTERLLLCNLSQILQTSGIKPLHTEDDDHCSDCVLDH